MITKCVKRTKKDESGGNCAMDTSCLVGKPGDCYKQCRPHSSHKSLEQRTTAYGWCPVWLDWILPNKKVCRYLFVLNLPNPNKSKLYSAASPYVKSCQLRAFSPSIGVHLYSSSLGNSSNETSTDYIDGPMRRFFFGVSASVVKSPVSRCLCRDISGTILAILLAL